MGGGRDLRSAVWLGLQIGCGLHLFTQHVAAVIWVSMGGRSALELSVSFQDLSNKILV